jgi:hypothetical protein
VLILGLSAAEERKRRWAAKKSGTTVDTGGIKEVSELSALADSLISTGFMEAYQLRPSRLRKLLYELENPPVKSETESPTKNDISVDMFG